MTVAKIRKLPATLPDHAQLCYSTGDEKGTIPEVSQVDVVRVVGDSEDYLVQDDGATRVEIAA